MSPQSSIAHYRIISKLGEGGMGAVYRAIDTKLNREVAIKILPDVFANDPDRLARFTREAQVLASLNHPNIAAIHGVEDRALIMELVDGPTLAERIAQGPIPLDQALSIARQIAEGLDAAHEKGIVHRDLKPANIKVTPDGDVKVLDFGLAKSAEASAANPENSPTLTLAATQSGIILGTAGYMSPEQAMGRTVDKRADIWAFGVVLYEMLAGHRLFQGENLTEVLASAVKEQPNLSSAPVEVRRLLARCLEKDPKKRLRDIGDVWELLEQQPAMTAAPTRPRLVPVLGQSSAWAAAAVLLVSTVVFGFLWRRTFAPERLSAQFEINPPGGRPFANQFANAGISPDGRYLVFGTGEQGIPELWLRPLDSLVAQRLPGTERANLPFWSPDSKSIGFYQEGKLKRADIAGGFPLVLCDAQLSAVAGGTWNRDGTILFTSGADIFRVPASGGTPQQVTSRDKSRKEIASGPPQFLPDGKHFLNLVSSEDPSATGIYAISLDRPKERVWIVATNGKATYLAPRGGHPGYLLWMGGQTLLAQRFDAGKLKLEGDPVPVAESVASPPNNPVRAAFWGSDAGVLAYRTAVSFQSSTLTWFDRQGKNLGAVGKPEHYGEIALSPDGSQIAAYRRENIGQDLWLIDIARGSSSRLTTGPGNHSYPVWSPDGKQIAFAQAPNIVTGGDLYRKPAGASGDEELLLKNGGHPLDWSRDGRFLLFARLQGRTRVDLSVLPIGEGERKLVTFLATGFRLRHGSFSPNGRWVMYASNVSGREEIYVSPFPDASKAPAVLVSTEGGTYPRWRRDGRAVYYLSPDFKLMEVEVLPGSSFKVGIPKPLFAVHPISLAEPAGWYWDISPDGQRFLFTIRTDQQVLDPLIVITNWQSTLKK